MIKKIYITLKIFSSALVAVAVVFAMLLVGARLFGLQVYKVLSGSMEPEYPTGSLIYVKEVDTAELKVDDVVTFKLTGTTIATHRIIEIIPDENGLRFRTQGDANDIPDGAPVSAGNIIGTPVFTIPYLGYIANYIQNPPGTYVAIAIAGCLILLVVCTDLLNDSPKNSQKNKNTENQA